jgi:peptide/nickel transport system substrate-binding protein
VLTRAGTAFRFTLLVPSNRPELPPMATAIQAQLKELGIALEVKPGPTGGIPQAHKDGSFQAALLSRTYVNVPDPIGTVIPDFTAAHTVWASEGWRNAALDGLVAEYVRSFDPARLPMLRARIAAILQAELPVVTVSWSEHTVGVSRRVSGVQIDPFEQRYLIERMDWSE